MKRFLLAIDIGNTIIGIGLMKDRKVIKTYRLETRLSNRLLSLKLKRIFRLIRKRYPVLKDVVICSVVPLKSPIVSQMIYHIWGRKPLVIGKNLYVPIRNRYHNPRQVGQDRLVGAYAAKVYYGVPAIVVDFGTAITFDMVSGKGEYLGGIIVPGIRLSAESLFHKTALLPKIKIKRPKSLIGKDTEGSILSGLFYGYGALSTGLIERIKRTVMPQKAKVIVTGGHLSLVRSYIHHRVVVDQNLVFKGIELTFRKGKR